jgi:hypothetical protein
MLGNGFLKRRIKNMTFLKKESKTVDMVIKDFKHTALYVYYDDFATDDNPVFIKVLNKSLLEIFEAFKISK